MEKVCVIETAEELGKKLLLNRGIKTEKEEQEFFNPKLEKYEKEFNLAGIAIAKKRILKAIENKELIIVYGDYDTDGLCGAAILYLGLTSIGAKILPYIPHREKEGFGLSEIGLEYAKSQGASLVITVDNGIVAIKQAKFAKKLGLDLIITDHHLAEKEKPEALAIIHSTKICGASVGWCVVRQLVTKEFSQVLLDLVALASIADMVPLLEVNRALVKAGLKKLNETKRAGLLALIKDARLELGNLNTYHLGYILGPRLNAKGRLEHAMDALRLLCTKDQEKAKNLARILSETNDQKKQLVEEAISEARTMIKISNISNPRGLINKKVLVLYSENWIPGIVGLIAGRVSEEYKVPTIAIACGGQEAKGSARSIKGINIVEAIRQCSDILIDVGGHPQAAGFTIETSKIEIFKSKLDEVMEKVKVDQNQDTEAEVVINLAKISPKWVEIINKFEPFGVGNQKPILKAGGVLANLRTVGGGQHLKGKVSGVDFIAFGKGSLSADLEEGQLVDLAGYLELDIFNGLDKLQFKVLDIK